MRDTIEETVTTAGGITVHRHLRPIPYEGASDPLVEALDARRGALFSSGCDVPGRYTRWDMGFVDPPLVLTARERSVRAEALNPRGRVLLDAIADGLDGHDHIAALTRDGDRLDLTVREGEGVFAEEDRSRQPSTFSVLRAVRDLFRAEDDRHLGLYGAFSYDLVRQFETIPQVLERPEDQRDFVLYLPDAITIVDHITGEAQHRAYDFTHAGATTIGLPRAPVVDPWSADGAPDIAPASDHVGTAYADKVREAQRLFARGDLFEAVLSQTFAETCHEAPSTIFRRLQVANPSPYAALINLGAGEFLVAASPEMYVRVAKRRVETCPISGTIARGRDAVEDAERIRTLLNSAKDEAELTMCTDVDRNDKARICEPGSVRVIARRQIELYSRLIHTVDHVEGELRDGFDALDAFLTHMWAVTVTGAPKVWAMRFVERMEADARRWYGGAIGMIGFDGGMNTGLTLRTVRMQGGVAEVRAGATLLCDSVPEDEDAECGLKAAAMLAAIRGGKTSARSMVVPKPRTTRRVLLVDHEDSFVHTLADYLRQAGGTVETLRPELARAALRDGRAFDLVVLSPGPARPQDFAMGETIDLALGRDLPIFGVCLGLQGLVEHFGGALRQLDLPMHGKPSEVAVVGGRLFDGLAQTFRAGRYHSLCAVAERVPDCLTVNARSEDGVIMGIEHRDLPVAAVQFHPESLLSWDGEAGLNLIRAVVARLERPARLAKAS